jgi:hypothetical protein
MITLHRDTETIQVPADSPILNKLISQGWVQS